MKECLDILSEDYRPDICSAVLATRVHGKCHDILGYDPYHEIKKRSNQVALELLPEAREHINSSGDPLGAAVMISIIGNIMDFGIDTPWKEPEALRENFHSLLEEGLGYSDLEDIRPYVAPGKNLLYFTDNCGEVVFDKLLMEEMKALGARVVVVVKGEPILTDATMEEAEELKLGEVADGILTTGTFFVGVDMENIPRELEEELGRTDLIIAKGMANYEALSEGVPLPTAFLLRTKCIPVAEDMGLEPNINAVKLVMPGP